MARIFISLLREKAPSTKHQAPEKHQNPSSKSDRALVEIWSLELLWSLVLGAWCFCHVRAPFSLHWLGMYPGSAVRTPQQPIGLSIPDHLAIHRIPNQGPPQLHGEISQNARGR